MILWGWVVALTPAAIACILIWWSLHIRKRIEFKLILYANIVAGCLSGYLILKLMYPDKSWLFHFGLTVLIVAGTCVSLFVRHSAGGLEIKETEMDNEGCEKQHRLKVEDR